MNVAVGQLLDWLRGQPPSMWHEIICCIEWNATRECWDLLDTVHWIVMQDGCDRATVITFLAVAAADGLDYETYGYLDNIRGKAAMQTARQKLLSGGYRSGDFAIPDLWSHEAKRICDPAAGRLWQNWGIPKSLIDGLAGLQHDPPFRLVAYGADWRIPSVVDKLPALSRDVGDAGPYRFVDTRSKPSLGL